MTQRAGRAGRLEPGICLHLIAKEQAERAAAQSEPEILQSDLSGLLMELLQWGCGDPAQMSWLDQPPTVNLLAAKRLLQMLGALDGERLSAQGQKMAALGNDPRLAAMLVSAKNDDEAATAAKLPPFSKSRHGWAIVTWAWRFRAINPPGSNVVSNC